MNYFTYLQGYLWDTVVILFLLTTYFQAVKRLSILKFICYCLPFSLIVSLFTSFLSDWTFGLIILLQIFFNSRKKIPIISIDTAFLLLSAVFLFIYGNILFLLENKLRAVLINSHSELIPPIFASMLIGILSVTMIICLILIRKYRTLILTRVTSLVPDSGALKSVILFLALLLLMEEVISVIADNLKVQSTFQAIIIICFMIFAILTIILMYYFVISYQRSLQAKHIAVEKKQQEEYLHKIESNYNELRHMRHDYQNILIALEGYLATGEIAESAAYIKEALMKTTTDISLDDEAFKNLPNLQVSGIRQLLFEKLKLILNEKIPVTLEIDRIINYLPGSQIDLARIIGILLDNALEASKEVNAPKIHIAIIKYSEDTYEFDIENILADDNINITELFHDGFSTKAQHTGFGLANVSKLTQSSEEFSLEVTKRDKYIRFSLMIQEMEDNNA